MQRKPGRRRAMSSEFLSNNYLNMGCGAMPAVMNPTLTRDMLDRFGYSQNPYTQSRLGSPFDMRQRKITDRQHCSFCFKSLEGVPHDNLVDGKARCMECSATVIKSLKEFKTLFEQAKADMQRFFGIQVHSHVKISMVSHRKVTKISGSPHTLGLACDRPRGRALLMVNGAPRIPALSTMVHELTHIWQYENWDRGDIAKRYSTEVQLHPNPDIARLLAFEGMSVWTEIQYMLLIGERDYAQRYLALRLHDPSEYGVGLALYLKRYSLSMDAFLSKPTPFKAGDKPLG